MTQAVAGDALVVGEALIDVVHRADGTVEVHPGGSPANVALTLGRLGRPARLLTSFGTDAYGHRIWQPEAVSSAICWSVALTSDVSVVEGSDGAARTSVATAHLSETGSATYEFELEWAIPPVTLDPVEAAVVHTGSIGAILEPGAAGVLSVLDAHRAHATVTYDPNLRPSLMGSATDVAPRVDALVSRSDVVKVSDEDLAWLAPGRDPVDLARGWLAQGPSLVVVTLGGEGAVAVTAQGVTGVPAERVEVVDTVGAGDSFMGALIDGLWHEGLVGATNRPALRAISGDAVERVLARCVRVAAITVSRAGANPPRRAELGATEL